MPASRWSALSWSDFTTFRTAHRRLIRRIGVDCRLQRCDLFPADAARRAHIRLVSGVLVSFSVSFSTVGVILDAFIWYWIYFLTARDWRTILNLETRKMRMQQFSRKTARLISEQIVVLLLLNKAKFGCNRILACKHRVKSMMPT